MCNTGGDIAALAEQGTNAVQRTTGINLSDDFRNTLYNVLTTGIYGYKNGQLNRESGFQTHTIHDFVGSINGSNNARKAAMDASAAADDEAARRNQELQNQRTQQQRQDLQASNTAGALRSSAAAQTQQYIGGSADLQKDFLGL